MIYEDKYSKKYYILMIRDNNLQFMEIKNKYKKNKENYEIKNLFESENDSKQFTDIIKGKYLFKGCVINKFNDNYNIDYLYLYFKGEGNNFIIIDLLNRKIIEKIKINKDVESILNWNNNNLILQSKESFYIFNTRNNKIISKYSNFSREKSNINSIKTFFSIKNNFYCLFTAESNINFYVAI